MADGTLSITEIARKNYLFNSSICESTYARSGSERTRVRVPRCLDDI